MATKKSRVSETQKAFKKGLIAENKKSSLVADSGRKAKPAGKRTSASGNKYTENRPNRSDDQRKKMPYLEKGGKAHRSIAKDKQRKAMHAGERTSADGNTYREYRPNRSDKNLTKKLGGGGILDGVDWIITGKNVKK